MSSTKGSFEHAHTLKEQVKLTEEMLDMLMELERFKALYPEIINNKIEEFESKIRYSVAGKQVDWKKIGGILGLILIDTTKYMYHIVAHQRNTGEGVSEKKLKILYNLMKRCTIKGAFFFKDSGNIELLGKFLELTTVLEDELGIINSSTLKRKGVSEEELSTVSQVFGDINLETLEKTEFDRLYKDAIKLQHPDKGGKDGVATAINNARDIVYKVKGW